MKKEDYTKEVLLDVMGSYLGWVLKINSGNDDYPTVTLSDLEASLKGVLKANEYDGRYKHYLSK